MMSSMLTGNVQFQLAPFLHSQRLNQRRDSVMVVASKNSSVLADVTSMSRRRVRVNRARLRRAFFRAFFRAL